MIVTRCLNVLTSEIFVTGYECSVEIVDFLDHYALNSFVSLSACAYMYAMLGVKSQMTFSVVSQGNNKKTKFEATLVSSMHARLHILGYPQRG